MASRSCSLARANACGSRSRSGGSQSRQLFRRWSCSARYSAQSGSHSRSSSWKAAHSRARAEPPRSSRSWKRSHARRSADCFPERTAAKSTRSSRRSASSLRFSSSVSRPSRSSTASSSCALESVYIDLDSVEDLDGRLTEDEKRKLDADRRDERVDFEAVRAAKRSALRRAWERFRDRELRGSSARAREFAAFQEEHREWLPAWALYRALHDQRLKSWRDWEPPLRDREPQALARAREELRDAIAGLSYAQWIADSTFRRGRA